MKEVYRVVSSSKSQFLLLSVLLIFFSGPAFTQNNDNSQQKIPLSLLPAEIHLYYQPDQLSMQYVRVTNQSDQSQDYRVFYDHSWIFLFPETFTLQPGGSKEVIVGFLFPGSLENLKGKSNTITFTAEQDQISDAVRIAIAVPQQTQMPQQNQTQQRSTIPQPQIEKSQTPQTPPEPSISTQRKTVVITPDTIQLPYGAQQLYVRQIDVMNGWNRNVTISANYDTSWIVTFPKEFQLAPQERKTVRAIFIGNNLTALDTLKQQQISFITKRTQREYPLQIRIIPPRRIAQATPPPVPAEEPSPNPQSASLPSNNTPSNRSINPGRNTQPENSRFRRSGSLPTQTQYDHLKAMFGMLSNQLTDEIKNNDIGLSLQPNRLVIAIAGKNSFDVGEMYPKESGTTLLDSIGTVLKHNLVDDMIVFVYGNTDTLPIIRPVNVNSNWDLSAIRAASVVNYLEKMIGIDGHYFQAIGRSAFSPIATNKTPHGRAQNRRIEMVITYKSYVREMLE